MTTTPEEPLLRATGRVPLTRAYDRVLALTMREQAWRRPLVDAVARVAGPSGTVVDVGAGTGTFAIALAGSPARPTVIAVDGDRDVQARAQRKPGAQHVTWREGRAERLPLADQSADVVVMSLVLHHLAPAAKHAALGEAFRVLRPEGALHIADWGEPHDALMRVAFAALQLVDGAEGTRDHAAGRLPALVTAAGFQGVRRLRRLRTVWGSLELLAARRPAITEERG